MHKSVGAIIENEQGDILMIDRKKPPLGWACPAGHIDPGETPEEALVREVMEEVGLEILESELVHQEFVSWNTCSRDVAGHEWYVFAVNDYDGMLDVGSEEAKDCRWVSREGLDLLELEEVWQLWHEKGFI